MHVMSGEPGLRRLGRRQRRRGGEDGVGGGGSSATGAAAMAEGEGAQYTSGVRESGTLGWEKDERGGEDSTVGRRPGIVPVG